MTERIDKARAAVLEAVRRYAPAHFHFSAEGTRKLNAALDEHHNAVVAATIAGMPQAPVAPVDPAATSVVPLVAHDPNRQPDAVGEPEEHAPKELPSPADQAAGKPVTKGKGKTPSIDKPPQ